ncbi:MULTISPECIES: ABC transporter substrate-binding protein [unclassified Rathayibacter]|uniref:ABC transporter substrate-binding protein n=1 Tax=unclassified Rathayibacter TaxID=2609250 RepID=UPI0015E325BD|nr:MULTISPECIES: extracellular solute-binding protein [unclassified Rathayibacter]
MPSTSMKSRRTVTALSAAAVTLLALTACSGGGGGGSAAATEFTFLAINENTTIPAVLTSLSENECSAENEALPLKINKQAQGSLDQQLQLLGGQNALPSAFVSANSPDLMKDLFAADKVADFTGSDIAKSFVPVAASSIASIYGDTTMVMPTELNIEGIWYNKQILKDNGITIPDSWDSLVSAFDTLKAAGVQPVSAAGKGGDGWGVTRWVGAYLYRELGPDAMSRIESGEAKLTDPEYVKAAEQVAALGSAGDFGPSPSSIDYATALNSFLTGDAAFIYMGSWAVSNFTDETANKIGVDNVGFMPFPTVDGGVGTTDQTPANVGTSIAFSKTAYEDEKVQNWASCISENYAAAALREAGQISGFTVNGDVEIPALTQQVQDQIAATDQSVAWFEALFGANATTTSQSNGGPLGAGQVSGQDFMNTVQSSLGQ